MVVRFLEISDAPRPPEGLPAPFVFKPAHPRRNGVVEGVGEVHAWCREHLGPGVEIGLDDDRVLGPDEVWGFWPGGAVFFREVSTAMWFKLVWS